MQLKSAVMLRVLINRYHQGSASALLAPLPQEEARLVLDQAITSSDPAKVMISPGELLSTIHYSWLVPVLEKFDEHFRPILIAALPRENARPLSHLLKVPLLPEPLPPIKKLLLQLICRKFSKRTILPVEYLPETAVAPLAYLSKKELIDLIDFLGIYDLAEEIRHIVDNVLLKALYACLSPKKKQFLRMCLHQKEKLKAPKIGLLNWKGEPEQLERLLHRRGIMRLGYALSGQPKDFVWHIVHKLDVGRGHLLSKYFSNKEIPGVSAFLAQQALNTLNFLTRKSPL